MTKADIIVKNMMRNYDEKYLTDREITSLDQINFEKFNFIEKLNVVPLSYRDRETIEEHNLVDSGDKDIKDIENPVLLQSKDDQANWFVVSLIDIAKYLNREAKELLEELNFDQNSFKLNGELKDDSIVTLENSSEFLVSREPINRKSFENLKDILTDITDKAREVIEDKASSWLNFSIFDILHNSREEIDRLVDSEVLGHLVLTQDNLDTEENRSLVLASSEEISEFLGNKDFNRSDIAKKIIETTEELNRDREPEKSFDTSIKR